MNRLTSHPQSLSPNTRFSLLRTMLLTQKQRRTSRNQGGFTLMESLMAIVVLTIMLVGIAPMLFLATATRVQARRVERAAEAARAYIDGVRAGGIQPPNSVVELQEVQNPGATNETYNPRRFEDFATVSAPALAAWSGTECSTTTNPANSTTNSPFPYCANTIPTTQNPVSATNNFSLFCVDRNGDAKCTKENGSDLIIQAYRSVSVPIANITDENARLTELRRGYLLGVRVYRADAFATGSPTLLTVRGDANNIQRTSGATFNRRLPLLEITTEVITAATTEEEGTLLKDFRARFGDRGPR